MYFESASGLILFLILGANGKYDNATAKVPKLVYDTLERNINTAEKMIHKVSEEIRILKDDIAQRNKHLLILRIQSRIAELEKPGELLWPLKYKDPALMTREERWTTLLTSDDRKLLKEKNVQEFRERFRKSQIGVERFVKNIIFLHPDSDDTTMRPIGILIPGDRENIEAMFKVHFKIPDPDKWKIETVKVLLDPIGLNK